MADKPWKTWVHPDGRTFRYQVDDLGCVSVTEVLLLQLLKAQAELEGLREQVDLWLDQNPTADLLAISRYLNALWPMHATEDKT